MSLLKSFICFISDNKNTTKSIVRTSSAHLHVHGLRRHQKTKARLCCESSVRNNGQAGAVSEKGCIIQHLFPTHIFEYIMSFIWYPRWSNSYLVLVTELNLGRFFCNWLMQKVRVRDGVKTVVWVCPTWGHCGAEGRVCFLGFFSLCQCGVSTLWTGATSKVYFCIMARHRITFGYKAVTEDE